MPSLAKLQSVSQEGHSCIQFTVKITSGTELEREQKGDADYADITTLTVKKFRVTSCEQSTYTCGTEQSCLLIFQETEVGWERGRSIWYSNSGRREYSCFNNTFRKSDQTYIKTGSPCLITYIYGRNIYSSYVQEGCTLAHQFRYLSPPTCSSAERMKLDTTFQIEQTGSQNYTAVSPRVLCIVSSDLRYHATWEIITNIWKTLLPPTLIQNYTHKNAMCQETGYHNSSDDLLSFFWQMTKYYLRL